MSFDSSGAFYCFSNGIYVSNYFNMRMSPSTNRIIIAPKWGVPSGNHVNDDVAEVKGSAAPNVTRLFPP